MILVDAVRRPAHYPKRLKVRGRGVSRGSEIRWLTHLPDLNPLDFYFWAMLQRRVYAAKPCAIAEVIDAIKQFASESSEHVLKDVSLDVLEKARFAWR